MPIVNTFSNGSARSYGWTSGGVKKILISSTPGPAATVTTYGDYIVFKFTASATLNVGAGAPAAADILVVAGGSPGAAPNSISSESSNVWPSSAGGAGGKVLASPGFTVTANSPIPVVIGGASTNSTFGPLTSSSGTPGGTGGARGIDPPNNTSNPGSPGSTGVANSYLTGSSQNYAGGGGGGAFAGPGFYVRQPTSDTGIPASGGGGGSAGGGPGGPSYYDGPFCCVDLGFGPASYNAIRGVNGSNGSANTGGGGGGAGASTPTGPGGGQRNGGTGGSGIVVARFPNVFFETSS